MESRTYDRVVLRFADQSFRDIDPLTLSGTYWTGFLVDDETQRIVGEVQAHLVKVEVYKSDDEVGTSGTGTEERQDSR